MESVLRGLLVYGFLMLVFRLSGKRTLAQTTNFELVLLLLISETTQQAMVNGDSSLTNCFLLIITLVGTGILLSIVKEHLPHVEQWLDGVPMLLVHEGRLLEDRMARARVDKEDILEAARCSHGLERLDQVKHAVLERNGQVSIVPYGSAAA